MGSLVWSTTGQLTGELLGRLAEAPLPRHAPFITEEFLRPFARSSGKPSYPTLASWVLSSGANTHTSPPFL